jgi:Na+/H+ antiporter NhaC
MNTISTIALLVLIAIVLILVFNRSSKGKAQNRATQIDYITSLKAEAQGFCDEVFETKKLPEIIVDISLKRDETDFCMI